MTTAEREPDAMVRWPAAVAGFLPPIALTLLPLLHPHPALALGPVLALPLYLLAAVQAGGYRFESSWFAALRARGGAALLLCALGVAATAALLAWPASRLLQTGSLGSVLLLSVATAALLLGFGTRWPAAGLVFLEDPPSPRQRGVRHSLALAQRVLEPGAGARGWFASLALLALFAPALALAWVPLWPQPLPHLALLLGFALLLAPLASWAVIECSARQLVDADRAEQDERESRRAAPSETAATAPVASAASGDDPALPLYAAARAGRVDEALALLATGADARALPDAAARDQRSLAVLAALLSDLRLLRALIGAGVDLNLRHAGLAPLLAATRDSWHGRPEAVMTLLANGADPRLADAEGRSALHGAALSTDPAVAALLLDAGAPVDAIDRSGISPLGVACANGNWRMARFLLEHGARAEPEGGQPVLLAAAGGEDDAAGVRLLLKHKARVDARGRLNRSALHVACLAGNVEIVHALIETGADVNARDEHGVTPLLEASRAGSVATVRALAARHPDPRATDATGRNALAIGCQGSRADGELVDQLLALGVDPQQACADGRRALDYAVAAGRWSLVARLDPHYPLPACVADASEELADVPPLARLRVALEARRHDHLRELLPLLREARAELAELLLEFAPRLDPPALRLMLSACEAVEPDAQGDDLLFRLLARGAAARDAIRSLLERAAQPGGRGGLARYLAAEVADAADADADADAEESEALALALLERGADAFGADPDGTPPLLLALRRDWPRLVAALLARGADPEARDARGTTALILACSLGQEDSVRRLVAHGAQPGTRAADGQTALGLALSSGRREIAHWLDWPRWPLPRRALRDADLPAAAQEGDAAAVARLLDLGLSIDARDAQGCTALLRACGGGHLALVDELLARGADPALAARSGATCLSAALSMRHDAVVQSLLARGAAPDQALPGGITPLMVAAALGLSKGAQALLAHGADARLRDDDGGSALHAAAQFGFGAREKLRAIALWDALLASGADPDAANGAGQTPLLLLLGARADAGATCDEEVVLAQLERLLARGVGLAVQERRGFGPLHLAALHGLPRVLRALLAAGADPDLRDSINRRPQEIALMRGFVDIASEFEAPKPAPSIARFLRPS
jgi:ankyrin repeat protein